MISLSYCGFSWVFVPKCVFNLFVPFVFNRTMTDVIPETENERWKYLFLSIKELTNSISDLKQQGLSSSRQMDSLSNRISNNEEKLRSFTESNRDKNIILFNLDDSEAINKNLFLELHKLFDTVKLQIPDAAITDAFRLGKSPGSRPVLIKFVGTRWVTLLFSKVKEINALNLRIFNDFSKEERIKRKNWLDLVRQLRALGYQAALKRNTIVVDDMPTSVEEVNKLLTKKSSNISQVHRHPQDQVALLNGFSTPQAPTPRGRGRPIGSTKKVKKPIATTKLGNFFGINSPSQEDGSNNLPRPTTSRRLVLSDRDKE